LSLTETGLAGGQSGFLEMLDTHELQSVEFSLAHSIMKRGTQRRVYSESCHDLSCRRECRSTS